MEYQNKLMFKIIGLVIAVGLCSFLISWKMIDVYAQQYWFVSTNGDTVCRAYGVQPTPFRFSYYCGNARGATAGSYTAVGNTATDIITIGLVGALGPSTSICMFAVNTTASPVVIGSFGTVGPVSVSYQCGASTAGNVPAN